MNKKTTENRYSRTQDIIVNAAFRAMMDNTEDMIFVKDSNLIYIAASMSFVRMVGKEKAEEIIGKNDYEIFEDVNLAERYITDDRKVMTEGKDLIDYMEPITDKDGQARYGFTSKFLLYDDNGANIGILGITRDVTREYITRQNYQRELKYLFELPEDMYAVCYIDVDNWHMVSQRRRLIGEGTLESCPDIEQLCETAVDAIVDEDCEAYAFYRSFSADFLNEMYASGQTNQTFLYRRRLTDGSIRWVHNEVKFLIDVETGHLCVMLSAKDIDTKMRAEEKLVEAAQIDKMTGLLNRETTMESIQMVLEEGKNQNHVLFMIDMDNFKMLNDTRGHQAGDEFLILLTGEIRKCFRKDDIVGRIGGDEFFALMKNVSDLSAASGKAEELLLTVRRICAGYEKLPLSVSIGISTYPQDGESLDALYAKADAALYQAKGQGKNQYWFAKTEKNA